MNADILLSRLEKVKRTGPGRWMARSPCRKDRTPSLSVRELDDGRVLVHDFGGASVEEVLSAVGLTFDDLFPPRAIGDHVKRERRPVFTSDVFDTIRHEVTVVALIGSDLPKNKTISAEDYERLYTAVERLNDIGSVAYGS